MAIAGSQKAGRRRAGKGQVAPSTPADVGATLRDAREAESVTVADVHDRTGISYQHLEALESGDLSRFPDRRTALVYLGRYADLFGLDAAELAPAIETHFPDDSHAGARQGPPSGTVANAGATPASYGHLSRFPGDGSHLMSFSQTAQVLGVPRTATAPATAAGRPYDGYAMLTGAPRYEPYPYVRPAPLGLRMAVWFTAALVILGGLVLATHKWDPQLLTSLHLVKSTQSPPSAPSTNSNTTSPTTPPVTIPPVTETSTGTRSGTFEVNAPDYSVVVTPVSAVWAKVEVPGTATPLFEGTMAAGVAKTFDAQGGPLEVITGSANVSLAVQISGAAVSGFSFTPPVAPFTATFTNVPTS